MSQLRIGDIWYGKVGTTYEGVQAKIENVTKRNVQVGFDRIVEVDGMQLDGTVFTKKKFQEWFDPQQQMSLFDFEG